MGGTTLAYTFELRERALDRGTIGTLANYFYCRADLAPEYFQDSGSLLSDFVSVAVTLEGRVPEGAIEALADEHEELGIHPAQVSASSSSADCLRMTFEFSVNDASGSGYAAHAALAHALRVSLVDAGEYILRSSGGRPGRRGDLPEGIVAIDAADRDEVFRQAVDPRDDPFVHVLGGLFLAEVYVDDEPIVRRDEHPESPVAWTALPPADRARVAARWLSGWCECWSCKRKHDDYSQKKMKKTSSVESVLAAVHAMEETDELRGLIDAAASQVPEAGRDAWERDRAGSPATRAARAALRKRGIAVESHEIVRLGCRRRSVGDRPWSAALSALARAPPARD